MVISRTFALLGILVGAFIINGCFQGTPSASDASAPKMQVSMKEPGILRRYQAFYVAPVDVYSVEGDYLMRVSQREVDDLAAEFRSKLIRKLENRSTAFPQPASNVALIKVSLTDVSTNYALFQLTPGLVVPNALRGGATIEAEFIDSVSGEKIGVVRDSRSGERQGFLSGLGKWDGVKLAFDEWAQLLAGSIRG